MKKTIYFLIIFFTFLLSSHLYGQNYSMGNLGTVNGACGGNFYDSGGSLLPYSNGENFTATFCAPVGDYITFTFSAFDVENSFEFLSVYNGPTIGSPLLGSYTGTGSPGTITSTLGGCLTFTFTSDGSVTSPGWNAGITCSPTPPPPPPPLPGTCTSAAPFCTSTGTTFPASTGTTAPVGPNYGCLGSQPNPAWYFLNVATTGAINIDLTNSASVDIDFIAWGPFSSQAAMCNDIFAGVAGLSCSYSSSAIEQVNIPNALAGEWYMVMITNYSNQPTNITATIAGSTGTTNCNILCNITGLTVTPSACDPVTDQYSVSGQITFTDPPLSGTLTVSSSCGGSMTLPSPWTSPISYTLPGITANGTACSITAAFSADSACTFTTPYTSPAACSNTCTVTASNSGPVCAGSLFNLTATNITGATYAWTDSTGVISSVQNPSGITAPVLPGSYTYTVVASVGTFVCSSSTTLIVNPIPTVSVNSPISCAGQSTTVTATPSPTGGTYLWNIGAQTTQSITVSPVVQTTYSVIYTLNGCMVSDSGSVSVEIPSTPANDATASPNPICIGSPTTLTFTGGSLGQAAIWNWYSGSCGGTLEGTGLSITVTPTTTTTYFVRAEGSCNTTACAQVTVSVDQTPNNANAGTNLTVCGQTAVLSGNTASVGTGQWSQVSGPGNLTFATPNNPGSAASVSGAPWSYGTYLINWTITNGMCSSSDTVEILFDQPVSPADGGQDFEICGNTIPVLGGIDPAVGTGQWTQIFGMDTINFSDNLFHNSSASVNTYGQYTVSWNVSNGSCFSSDTISLVFKEAPTTSMAGTSQEICGLSTTMAGNIALAGQGLWTKVSGPGNLSFVNTTGSNSSVVASAFGDYIIKWTISNFNCISQDTLKVTFYESPSIANAGKDTLLCNLKEHFLNALSPLVGAGFWSVSKGPSIIFDPTLNNSLVIDLETGTNEFVWTNKNGVCPLSRDTMNVTISKAEAHFESNYYELYVDDILQLVDSSLINPVKWSWTFGDGGTSFIQHPKHAYLDTGLFSINLLMKNEHGCVDSLEKMVKVYKPFSFYVPNSFSPNGDGINDEFKAFGDGISQFDLLIFNRWGELIFRNNNSDTGWNGRKNNGSGNVLPGVYIYRLSVFDYHGKEKKQEGTITLIK